VKLRTVFVFVLAAMLLAACASQTSAPVIERSAGEPAGNPPVPTPPAGPDYYTVKHGDTLYSIALDHGQDYRDVATWNNLANANVIAVGQVLRVRPPVVTAPGAGATPEGEAGAVVVRPITPPGGEPGAVPAAPSPSNLKTEPNGAKRPYSEEALAQAQKETREPARSIVAAVPNVVPPAAAPGAAAGAQAAKAPDAGDIVWAWPAAGKVIASFSEGGANKGVDIAAKVGEPVYAAAPGKVVYSGQGLRGYGRLVIIKHNGDYLSAYAHNSSLLVKEGQTVTKGQQIAEAGNTDSDIPKLHFEIRRQGKPVDPVKFLPER
jgi:lipoprotein NlpD